MLARKKSETPISVVTRAEWPTIFGSKLTSARATSPAAVPNHSLAARKTTSEMAIASSPAASLMRKTSLWLAPSLRASQSRPFR